MIKVVFCLRRNPKLSIEEFQTYWREHHGPLVARYGPFLRMQRYVQSHRLLDPRYTTPGLAARGTNVAQYDGIAEIWWRSLDDVFEAGLTPEGQEAGRILLEDERQFIDLAESSIFYTAEHSFIGDQPAVY
jgi:uncharacterized protein (TIGR02118 family)